MKTQGHGDGAWKGSFRAVDGMDPSFLKVRTRIRGGPRDRLGPDHGARGAGVVGPLRLEGGDRNSRERRFIVSRVYRYIYETWIDPRQDPGGASVFISI